MCHAIVTILLVEDDTDHAEMIRRAFQSHDDMDLTIATTVKEARGRLEQSAPDLMLVDLVLPDGHGTELFPPREEELAFPVVLMTSFGNEQVAAKAIRAGVMDYIVKSPATLRGMPEIADQALKQWQRRTARKREQQRLLLLSSAVEQSTEGLGVVDLDGHILFVNEAIATMHGYAAKELIGKHLSVLHIPEQMPPVEASLRQVVETGDFSGEIWHARRDGSVFPALMRNSLLHDESGKPLGVIGTMRDITELKRVQEELTNHRDRLEERVEERTAELAKTNVKLTEEIAERKQTEKLLRESEQQMRMLLETTPHGIVDIDTSGVILGCNRAYQRILGYTEEELIGANVVDFILDELRDDAASHLNSVVENQPSPSRYEIRHRTKDGRTILCDVDWDYKRDTQGQVLGFVSVITDVTEQKQAAEELRKERRLLQQMLNLHERERKLISYEIHDGLAQQLTGAQMVFQTVAQQVCDDSEKTRQLFDKGLELLRDSLSETRQLISGLRPPILDESGVVAAVECLIDEQQQRETINIELVCQVQFDRLAAPLETAIYRIVQESLTNACRHSRSDKVRVELTEQEGHVSIEVRDWGVGCNLEELPEDRFGLQGIRERARLFGGHATIESAPGQGTCVSARLPILPEAV